MNLFLAVLLDSFSVEEEDDTENDENNSDNKKLPLETDPNPVSADSVEQPGSSAYKSQQSEEIPSATAGLVMNSLKADTRSTKSSTTGEAGVKFATGIQEHQCAPAPVTPAQQPEYEKNDYQHTHTMGWVIEPLMAPTKDTTPTKESKLPLGSDGSLGVHNYNTSAGAGIRYWTVLSHGPATSLHGQNSAHFEASTAALSAANRTPLTGSLGTDSLGTGDARQLNDGAESSMKSQFKHSQASSQVFPRTSAHEVDLNIPVVQSMEIGKALPSCIAVLMNQLDLCVLSMKEKVMSQTHLSVRKPVHESVSIPIGYEGDSRRK